ncbi:glycosyltransferase [Thiohalophilus sp.]|uniref:glycosyltransferase n=1 Tax=Thiohalophilus sp. TaxID=3028392 RepID=UPI002ACED428|nr:glycosyltransferase [Thiohalophilus sp.]MDZ7802584.1 glycosyltransferase [Thiohalophilus sp.]
MNHPPNPPSDEALPVASLRIAFFSDSLPERNGTGAYYHDLLPHLLPRVEAAEVIQPRPRGRFSLLSVPLPGDPTQQLVTPSLPRIRRQLRALRPNIIVCVTPGPFGLLGMWAARRHRCGFISAYHTDFEGLADLYWGPLKKRIVNGFMRGANRFISRRSGTVLVNNSGLADDVTALGAPAVDVMGTPLEPGFLNTPAAASPTALRQVCFAGRLAAEKNIDSFIDAARQHPALQFVIGGDGPLRKSVQAAADELDNLSYRGWLSREALRALIDESSLLVLPSHMETFGTIALEAMARGRPALVSEHAGIHDWPDLADGLFTLPAGQSVADALTSLVAEPAAVWQRKSSHAREAAEALNRRTVDQWLTVLARHARGGRA